MSSLTQAGAETSRRGLVTLAVLFALAPCAADAAPPELLVFGGGWGPEGTQASIEVHVEALARALPPRRVVLFANGGRGRAVQVPAKLKDATSSLLGLVFRRQENLHVDYRPSRLAKAGASSRDAVLTAILEARSRGPAIVFGAGHGASATDDAPAAIELWGPDDRLDVPDLAAALDGRPGHPTALVLGHCHSGAFMELMFTAADPQVGLADPVRCVFAAVPADREAAGCTPDVQHPDARAYLAMFARGLATPGEADLDGDGALSLTEAHAFARIHDGTVDMPVKSTDLWLQLRLGDRAPRLRDKKRKDLLLAADPAERHVLKAALPSRFKGLEPAGLIRAYERLTASQRALDEHIQGVADRHERVRQRIVDALLTEWPELVNPYHVTARSLLADDAPEVVAFIRRHPELPTLLRLDRSISALDEKLYAQQRETVRIERWLHAAQRVANEQALRGLERPALVAALERLEACEQMVVR